jgi:hypothetical protein
MASSYDTIQLRFLAGINPTAVSGKKFEFDKNLEHVVTDVLIK